MRILDLATRAASLWQRRRRARRFSIPYSRNRDWRLPAEIKIGQTAVSLNLPKDGGTSTAFLDIFVSDVYGLERLSKNSIRRVVDVGAHCGLFSLAARHYFPEATIHAYEPNPVLKPYLNTQAQSGTFAIFSEGVAGSSGIANLHFGEDTVHTKCVLDGAGAIPIVGIAEVICRACDGADLDLLKMDCEGSEWSIFQDQSAIRRVRFITMEYHVDENRKLPELVAILERLSFHVDYIHTDGPSWGRVWASRR